MDARRKSFWELHDFSSGKASRSGRCTARSSRKDEGDVRYIDIHDREGIVSHYEDDPAVAVEDIPEIDFHLIQPDGRTLTLVEATKSGAPFDWVVASHVIEHVPDLIGWLAELADDRRGRRRPGSRRARPTVLLRRPPAADHGRADGGRPRAGNQRPSVPAVYDYFSSVVDADRASCGGAGCRPSTARIHSLDETRHQVERTLAGEYVDCHVWLFTPTSFLRQLHELRVTGRSEWFVERWSRPRRDLEFRVVMRRLPRGSATAGDRRSEVLAEGDMPDWLVDQVRAGEMEALEQKS